MKKIFYSIAIAFAALLTSCGTEDKGTSFEVANANQDEVVKPSHLHDYYRPGTASFSTTSVQDGTTGNNTGSQGPGSQPAGGQPNSTTDQSNATTNQNNLTAVDLVVAYYTKNDPVEYYSFSSTQRMGGQAMKASSRIYEEDTTGVNNNTDNVTNMTPGSTTADGQGYKGTRTDNKQTGEKKKERLTPYVDDKKQNNKKQQQ